MKGSKDCKPRTNDNAAQTDLCRAQTCRALLVCDRLEALADQLPRQSIRDWRTTQQHCKTVLFPYFTALNDVILPQMLALNTKCRERSDLLARFMADCTDQLHALFELDSLMNDVLRADRFGNEPEALGYALRGFFETLRRDLRWQFDVLWPLAERTCPSAQADHFVRSFGQSPAARSSQTGPAAPLS